MDNGAQARLTILKRDAESKILGPLQLHGWQTTVLHESKAGDGHLICAATRGEHRRVFALLYSSASSNATYKSIEQFGVDHILINGELWKLQDYAFGIKVPISSADQFISIMIDWNKASSTGKFAPNSDEAQVNDDDDEDGDIPRYRVLLSEAPIDAIWLRIRQLHSVKLAERQISENIAREKFALDGATVRSKSEGVAFALRNATDYFNDSNTRNVSQRILNLYYGSMAFAFAEMLAAPKGPTSLSQIEDSTKRGHGLYTLDGQSSDLKDLVVGLLRTGFFTSYISFLGNDTEWTPKEKAKDFAGLAKQPIESYVTLEQIFARVPEISDLFLEIFDSPTLWLNPTYDMMANRAGFTLNQPKVTRGYCILTDVSGRMSLEQIAEFSGPISEIQRLKHAGTANKYRVAVDHVGYENLWGALELHRSPLGPTAIVKPMFNGLTTYRATCLALLYALSIIVRYRPSVWRRVQDGDLDHWRALIEAFLTVAERVLPEHFLTAVTGTRIFAKQPGSFG
jgi:hypothetical protein